jgi:2-keto-4-pentenoate hydratase/2-oxohepta-3-ene-1,7-dioic acid hydratase in catechol pathway
MNLGSCIYQNETMVFIEKDNQYYLPGLAESSSEAWSSMQQLIEHPDRNQLLVSINLDHEINVNEDQIQLLAPIPRPKKNVICMGLNYFDHIAESASAAGRTARKPKAPIVFTKANTSVIGPFANIPDDPEVSEQLDWEVELAIVIGKTGKKIPLDKVRDYIFGYTIINDISARDLQFAHKQFYIGKSIDGGCPMGPVIVTKDSISDPQNLTLSCHVNGVEKQSSSTSQMIFTIDEIVSTLSNTMTLEAGDVIATGTPDGVGFARTPPEYLKDGDIVTCTVESIGILENTLRK